MLHLSLVAGLEKCGLCDKQVYLSNKYADAATGLGVVRRQKGFQKNVLQSHAVSFPITVIFTRSTTNLILEKKTIIQRNNGLNGKILLERIGFLRFTIKLIDYSSIFLS